MGWRDRELISVMFFLRLPTFACIFSPMKSKALHRRQEIEAIIEKLAFGGQGIAHHDGFVIFIEDTLPGDHAKARVRKVKKNYAEAYPVEILKPSELRIEAPCCHFDYCGGCKWQNLDYQMQLHFKKQHVIESLQHIGGVSADTVHDVLPSPLIFGYRNKMEFSFALNRWLPPEQLKDPTIRKDVLSLGFHVPRHFDKIIDIEKCWLQDDRLNRILEFSKEHFRKAGIPVFHNRTHEGILRYLVLRKSFAFDQIMVNIVTFQSIADQLHHYAEKLTGEIPEVTGVVNNVNPRFAQIATGEEEHVILGEPVIREKLGDYVFEISANSFFQTNTLQAENLYRTVERYADVQDKVVWDLYSGTGSIAIFLSGKAKKVVGFEIVEDSVQDAQRNAEINRVSNCDFIAGDLRFAMEQYSDEAPQVIICDPPRAGMHPRVVEMILQIAPAQLVYVSCNPATLARDLGSLTEMYRLVEVQPVDMFPHTYHIESVCRLVRK